MRICTLCNGTMKKGDGQALFTAECSDSFHFKCIASYMKLGNQICPICQAKWNDILFQGSTSDLSNKRAKLDPEDSPQLSATPTMAPQLPARSTSNESKRHRKSLLKASEPVVDSNDDESTFGSQSANIDAAESNSITLDIKTYPEVSAVRRSSSQENFNILINLQAHVTGRDLSNSEDVSHSRAPIDLVTVLDVSGSMTGSKLALLKKAMGFVIENLGPSDRLSVIAFSNTARCVVPLRIMTESRRQRALEAVNSLRAGGATNIIEGLREGAKVIKDKRKKNLVCSIMLLSDGQDSYKDRFDLHQLRLQIPVHTFGFGADHDPVMLNSISEACRGTFSFVEAAGLIQDAFAQCLGGLLSVVVQDLQVHVESVHPDVCLGKLRAGSYSTNVTNDNRKGFIDVGDLYADEERDFLVLVNVPVIATEDSRDETNLINVRCSYKDPFSKETITTEVKEVKIQRPEVLEEGWVVVSTEVDRQRNRLQAAEAMAESRRAAESGDLSSAWSILDSCRRELSDSASSHAGDQLCIALDEELKEVRARMSNMNLYKSSGRAYVLSGMSSHLRQRASTRSGGRGGGWMVSSYRTRPMAIMMSKSQQYR